MSPPPSGGEVNPYLVHRRFLDVHRRALDAGLTDDDYVTLVAEADERVAAVDGTGFRTTPLVDLRPDPVPAGWPSRPVVAKVETGNVSGSHKARHLFGALLSLLVDERAGGVGGGAGRPPLAIASCGNAALGAAVVAAAAERALRVFVPVDADPIVLDRLHDLGADVAVCRRREGEAGDPCVHALDAAVGDGARPFTVQGPRCPEAIDGGRTIGLELAAQLDHRGLDLGDLYVQIGGGALATAAMDGLVLARPDRPPPRLHPVQARSAHPYVAGWDRLSAAMLTSAGSAVPPAGPARTAAVAEIVPVEELAAVLDQHREHMSPWPTTPTSVASGILDDVAYDWRTVAFHQVTSGGWPVLVDEASFVAAAELAASLVAPPPDATGAAGLAGMLVDPDRVPVDRDDRAIGVLLTGVERSGAVPSDGETTTQEVPPS